MANIVFSNQASSLLAASVVGGDLVLQVGSGDGALFPSPGVGQHFKVALVNALGDFEICHCTSRAGDLLTVTRGQEGTSAQAWTNGATRVELRLTAGTMQALLQKTGDVMSSDLDMDGNELIDAVINAPTIVGGQVVAPLRGAVDLTSNEVVVPSDGSRATAGGSPIITAADNLMTLLPISTILMWYGSLGALPAGWQSCDGTNGSPDLRDAFPRGAGGALALGASGGAATASGNTGAAGAHSHGVTVDGHVLSTAEIPSHSHSLRGSTSTSGSVDENFQGGGMAGPAAAYNGGPTALRTNNSLGEALVDGAGGGGSHNHTATSDAAADHTHTLAAIATIPPYKAVYFIMKVA